MMLLLAVSCKIKECETISDNTAYNINKIVKSFNKLLDVYNFDTLSLDDKTEPVTITSALIVIFIIICILCSIVIYNYIKSKLI